MEPGQSTMPTFVAVFIPENNGSKLEIPARVSTILQESVTLTDKYNNKWHVRAEKVDGHWYLLDGWAKFLVDSSVSKTEVLHFKCSGQGSLDVTIFGRNRDLMERVGSLKLNNPEEHHEIDNKGKEILDESTDAYFDSTDWNVKQLKSVNINKDLGCFGNELFESGEIPLPTCKMYFVTKISHEGMYKLHIPKDIIDTEFQLPEHIELVDPVGNTYPCGKVISADGRTFYHGMSSLCRDNNLAVNDICICEFGEGDESGYLYINYVRRGSSRIVGPGWVWAE